MDHNRLKNFTLDKAKEEGLTIKRFNMDGKIELNSRAILSVNQCKKSNNLQYRLRYHAQAIQWKDNGKGFKREHPKEKTERKEKQKN